MNNLYFCPKTVSTVNQNYKTILIKVKFYGRFRVSDHLNSCVDELRLLLCLKEANSPNFSVVGSANCISKVSPSVPLQLRSIAVKLSFLTS